LLYCGAEWLVKGSAHLARSLGLSPTVIGLTVVAFGTSSPELFISVVSSIKGKSMIAVGNVVGSNICNIALVLALTAFFRPVTGSRSVIGRDIPLMLGASFYLLVISLNSKIGRFEGASLFFGICLYTWYNYYVTGKTSRHLPDEMQLKSSAIIKKVETNTSRIKQIVLIVTGIAGVVAGADLLIDSSVKAMKVLGVSEKFVGLTIVAFGTSVPEIATSAVAALRKEMDISIGNLIGSNVFNILGVLGAASLIKPILIPGGFIGSGLIIDYIVMMFINSLLWVLMRKDLTVQRNEALILFSCYVGYVAYLIIKS
jgi:cation:H+ antiporter